MKKEAGGTKGNSACNSFKILNIEVGLKKNIAELISLFRTVQYEVKVMYSLVLLFKSPFNGYR